MTLRFLVILFLFALALPACVHLTENNDNATPVVRQEVKTLTPTSLSKRSSSVYKEAPYDPREWEKVSQWVGPRRALTSAQSYRYHSAKSEAGWFSRSGPRIFSNSASASYAIGQKQAAEQAEADAETEISRK